MISHFSHTFSKQLNKQEKEAIFDFIKVKLLEDTKVQFTTKTDILLCKIPFFVSRGNSYGIFDAIQCTFDGNESENTRIYLQTFHFRAIMGKIGVGIFFGILLFYTVDRGDIFWKILLYGFLVLTYILMILWRAQQKNKKLFQKIIAYSESL